MGCRTAMEPPWVVRVDAPLHMFGRVNAATKKRMRELAKC
jgi:hypothetical protein